MNANKTNGSFFGYIPDEALTVDAPAWVIDAFIMGPEEGQRDPLLFLAWACFHQNTNVVFKMARVRWREQNPSTVGDFVRYLQRAEQDSTDYDAYLAVLVCYSWTWIGSGGSTMAFIKEMLVERHIPTELLPPLTLTPGEWRDAFLALDEDTLSKMTTPLGQALVTFGTPIKSCCSFYVDDKNHARLKELAAGFSTADWVTLWTLPTEDRAQLESNMKMIAAR